MHIVENHENLKRMYTGLLSAVEEKEDDDLSICRSQDDQHNENSDQGKKKKGKEGATIICKFGEDCRYGLDCKFEHPERNNTLQSRDDSSMSVSNLKKAKKTSKKSRVSTTPCRNGPACEYLRKSGYCMFNHPEVDTANSKDEQNENKLPIIVPCRNGPSCKYYLNGNCRFGHPENKQEKEQDGKNEKDKHLETRSGNQTRPLYSVKAKGNIQDSQGQSEQKNLMEGMQKNMHSLKMTMTNMMAEITQMKKEMKARR